MAIINGEWVDAHTRDKTIEQLKERLEKYIEANKLGKLPDELKIRAKAIGEEIVRLERIKKASEDSAYFAYMYLSDKHNPDNPDNAIKHLTDKQHDDIDKIAPIHREFFSLCNYIDESQAAG